MKNILVINAGSSSLKFAVFQQPLVDGAPAIYRGLIDAIGEGPPAGGPPKPPSGGPPKLVRAVRGRDS